MGKVKKATVLTVLAVAAWKAPAVVDAAGEVV